MSAWRRVRELGWLEPGFPSGPHGDITDVPGVRVGHRDIRRGAGESTVCTGVSVVLPHGGNLFREPVVAAVHVINGFGKPAGFEQVRELGQLETPIALTNTLGVGAAHTGLVRHALAECAEIGREAGTVNPVVAECNDGRINDIRSLAVTPEDVLAAIADATTGPAPQGCVGAGSGMVAFGWKAGIGSASALVEAGYTVGALCLVNFGRAPELTIRGIPVGRVLPDPGTLPAAGSIVCVLATDAPLDARQLGRVARRAQNGIARVGGQGDSGSGEFVIAFSTSRGAPPLADRDLPMDTLFRVVADTVQVSILDSLLAASDTVGRTGLVPALPADAVSRLLAASDTVIRPTRP